MKNETNRGGQIAWPTIDTVLLDMDGTLLDRHFDDYFWNEYVPARYAETNCLPLAEAKRLLQRWYQEKEGTLAWTDLDIWTEELGLDIPQLKWQVEHLIQVHPYVIEFLEFCRRIGKTVCLVTNAHSKTLAIKLEKTALARHFDHIVCAEQIGLAKEEDPRFWEKLMKLIPYEPHRTLLADDTESVLDSAAAFGIRHLVFVARPSSRAPVRYSPRFPSIVYFKELLPSGQ